MSNLLRKASIITTPTAYAEDYLYSVKPAYALGENLVSNGGFDTDTDWSKTTGWTISGGKANWNPAVAPYNNDIYRAFSFVEGTRYRITFTMSNNTTGRILLRLSGTGNQDVNGGYTYYANGTHTVEFKGQANKNFLRIYGHYSYSSFSIDDFSLRIITDADFDFDRNSTGTRVNEDYLIEDVPYNLLTYSTDFTFWTQADTSTVQIEDSFDNSNNAYRVSIASGTGFQTIRKTGLNVSGQQTFSIYAKKDTLNFTRILFGGFGNFWVDLANGTQGTTTGSYDSITITNAGNGFFKIVATFTATSPVTHVYLYPSTADGNVIQSSGSVIFQYAQLVKGDQPKDYLKTTDRLDIPRIDYTNGEPSILLEPSRTNEVTYSQDFTQSYWSKNNVTVTSNQAISPDGIQNADKLIIDNGTVSINGGLYKSRSSTQNQDVSFSIFAKAGEFRYGTIAYGSTNANGFHFDLEDGVILSTFTSTSNYTNIGYEMIPYPNGWYKLVVNTTELVQGLNRYVGIRPHNTIPTSTNNNYNSTGDGTSGIFIYGGQIEVGSYATSLIHTSGSAVTRSADVANNAGNSDLFNDSEGVLYCEIKALANDGTFREITLNDGTVNNVVELRYNNVDNQIQFVIRDGGSVTVNSQVAFSNILEYNKIAFQYKANDFKVFANGRLVATDTAGTVPSGLNKLDFSWAGNNNFYGNAKMVAVFKEALSDEELACLTSPNNNEIFLNYYNRMQYVNATTEAMGCAQKTYTI